MQLKKANVHLNFKVMWTACAADKHSYQVGEICFPVFGKRLVENVSYVIEYIVAETRYIMSLWSVTKAL